MRKGMFKWMRPKVGKTMIGLIVLAAIAVHYEKKIWHEIDPMSDKWVWSSETQSDFWEHEEKKFEDGVEEIENDVDDWEDDVVDWVDETEDDIRDDAEDIVFGFDDSFLIEERTMDQREGAFSEEQELKHHKEHHDDDDDEHEHEHDHKDKKEHSDHHHHEDKMRNFRPPFVLDACFKLLEFFVYMMCVKKVWKMKRRYIHLSEAKDQAEGKTEEEKQKILSEAIQKKWGCCRGRRMGRGRGRCQRRQQ